MRHNYYNRVDRLLHQLSTQVKNELSHLDKNTKMTQDQRLKQTHNLHNAAKNVRRIRMHLRKAQVNYHHYNRLRVQKYHDLNKLQKSLRVQAHYMRMEFKYIQMLEKESVKFRNYPKEYNAIRKELRELRRQLNIELNDLRAVYRKLHSKILRQRNMSNRHRNLEKRRMRNHRKSYNMMVGRYNVLRKQYNGVMRRIYMKLKKNKKMHGQLRDELRTLEELRKVLKGFNPSNLNKAENRYKQCRNDLNKIHYRLRKSNCTI